MDITRKTVVTEARRAYWNLLYLVKAEGITREVLDLYRHLERVAASRYETGSTSYQDVIKVRIRREILEENLKTVIERKQNLKSRILALLNLPPESRLGRPQNRKPPQAVPNPDNLYGLARERRQELKRLRARIGRMERLIELAETRILPQYTFGLSFYENITTVQIGTSAQKPDFPVSTRAYRGAGLPLEPWYGIGDAYIRETQQKLSALKKTLQNAEATTNLLVREAWYRLDLAKREEILYRKSVLKLAKDALDVSTRGYEAGNVSFADVIASYALYLNQNLSAERKLSDMGIARADLEMVVGSPLSQKKKERNP